MKSKTSRTLKNTSKTETQDEKIERIKFDLLSLVSHELKTPLTGVLNALAVLREESLSIEEKQKYLDMATRNAERLKATLGQLLDLSKITSGRMVCSLLEVSLRHFLITEIENLAKEAEHLGFEIEKDVESFSELPVILGDSVRLKQVLQSLFDNAFKFSPAHSKIGFKVTQQNEPNSKFVVLELSNSLKEGVSTKSKADLSKIFSQQESVLERVHEGVGGSLAIAVEVLRQHGGSLRVQQDDERFTVWVTLPVLESEQGLIKVLESRMHALKTELGAVSLVILEVEKKSIAPMSEHLKAALFRVSDSVYSLPNTGQIAVVMGDCKKSDVPKLMKRLLAGVGVESKTLLKAAKAGLASCPEDSNNAEALLDHARNALAPITRV